MRSMSTVLAFCSLLLAVVMTTYATFLHIEADHQRRAERANKSFDRGKDVYVRSNRGLRLFKFNTTASKTHTDELLQAEVKPKFQWPNEFFSQPMRNHHEHSVIMEKDVMTNALDNIQILKQIGAITNLSKSFVNIGAGDDCILRGFNCDEANGLMTIGFYGFLVEPNTNALSTLTQDLIARGLKSFRSLDEPITIQNAVKILTDLGAPKDVDLLKIDIDRNDCDVVKNILEGGFRPKVIQMEYNPLIPPPIQYNWPSPDWPTMPPQNYNECSLQYLADMLKTCGYGLLQVDVWDTWFVYQEFFYTTGYKSQMPLSWWTHTFRSSNTKVWDLLPRTSFMSQVSHLRTLAEMIQNVIPKMHDTCRTMMGMNAVFNVTNAMIGASTIQPFLLSCD